jgi:tetratricopeptide (TPR) repeat protein
MKRAIGFGALVIVLCGSVLAAQTVSTKSDAEVQKEDLQAQALVEQVNYLAALPLYEDLHTQRPTNNKYREQLAVCLMAKAIRVPPAESVAIQNRAHALLLEAKAAGDNSNFLQILLEKTPDHVSLKDVPTTVTSAQKLLGKAETAFSSGDMKSALDLYKQAAETDPKMYEAPLYAGDAEYKLKNYDEASIWYAKAIAIDPDRETAYRYWGDVLMHEGDQKKARYEFIEAIIANPYAKTTWIGLKQWADSNHALLSFPPINLPKRPEPDAKGNLTINVDPSTVGSPTSGAWLMYSMKPSIWRSTEFKKHYPNETAYRHSLAEEADSLRGVLAVLKEQKIPEDKLDATLKSLIALEKDGMLESWILLNHADQGIAQDYVAYRATHRELLHAYVEKYVVHPN